MFVNVPHVSLVLLQDHMTGELRLGDAREAPDDHQQSLETCEPQLVTVVCRRHERHTD